MTATVVSAAEIPWGRLGQLAHGSAWPRDAVLHHDATHAVLLTGSEGLVGALVLRVDAERVRVRNLLLAGSARARLRRLTTLVVAGRQYGAEQGWSRWTVRLSREWSFYRPIRHAIRRHGGRLDAVDSPHPDEHWSGTI